MTARERVFAAVHAERERQTEKWGDQWKANGISPERKLAILVEEVGEVAKEVLEGGEQYPSLREELVQCAAVCCAWIESLNGKSPGEELPVSDPAGWIGGSDPCDELERKTKCR